jgi:hypothetical protein
MVNRNTCTPGLRNSSLHDLLLSLATVVAEYFVHILEVPALSLRDEEVGPDSCDSAPRSVEDMCTETDLLEHGRSDDDWINR